MKITYHITLILLLGITACNSDKVQRPEAILKTTENKIAKDNPVVEERKTRTKREPSVSEINKWRSQALSIINHRLKEFPKTYAIVEANTWEYQFVHDGEMSQPGDYSGVWIDYKNDHTYEYGDGTVIKGSGKYNFHLERGEILMVDDDPSKKPNEWRVKHADDIMIMMGTPTYKDNHIQQKLGREPDSIRPQ